MNIGMNLLQTEHFISGKQIKAESSPTVESVYTQGISFRDTLTEQ